MRCHKKWIAMLMAGMMLLSQARFALAEQTDGEEPRTYSLEFTDQVQEWKKSTNAKFGVTYVTATAVYCQYPTHPGVQSVAIYAPADYVNEDGTINKTAQVGQYTAETAPMVYWNSSGSYIGMGPFKINGNSTRSTQYGWVLNLINNGIVVCMAGERGKTTTDDEKNVIGRGPVAISDLKAGVRFLKHNDAVIPGSAERIISVGTSSGGAMSSLLGASGNNPYYEPWLEAMGACMEETDDVYATQAYCPITDLSHADYAYAWTFGVYQDEMTDFEKALNDLLAQEFVSYINHLGLVDENGNALTLAEGGSKSGTYYDWLMKHYEAAFEDYAANFEEKYARYATGAKEGAADAAMWDFLTWDAKTGTAAMNTPEGYDNALDALVLSDYVSVKKGVPPAFDKLEMLGGDNELFGEQYTKVNTERSARHYNQTIAEMIGSLKEEFPKEFEEYYQLYDDESHEEEVENWSIYLNAYSFLTGAAESDVSPYFRICMGTQDTDTSPFVSATLALLLQQRGVQTQFKLLWAWGHNDVDTPTGLLDWIQSICP